MRNMGTWRWSTDGACLSVQPGHKLLCSKSPPRPNSQTELAPAAPGLPFRRRFFKSTYALVGGINGRLHSVFPLFTKDMSSVAPEHGELEAFPRLHLP